MNICSSIANTIINPNESSKLITWLKHSRTSYLYLHTYNIRSPGYMIIIDKLPSTVDTISLEFNLCRVNEDISLYLNVLEKLKLSKIKHLHVVFSEIAGKPIDAMRRTIKYQLLPAINALLACLKIESVHIRDTSWGRVTKPMRNFLRHA